MYGESRREEGTGPPLVEKQLEKGCEKKAHGYDAIRGNWEGYGVCILHTPGGATDMDLCQWCYWRCLVP